MSKNRALGLMALIFLVSFNLRVGIVSVPPILNIITKELQLTNFQGSLLTSIPVICMGILSLAVATIQNKFGRIIG